jgi:hypothetical protein
MGTARMSEDRSYHEGRTLNIECRTSNGKFTILDRASPTGADLSAERGRR